jgi:dephospho-CoA kinase
MISCDSDCSRELSSAFGKEILNEDHSVDRKKLASLVFSQDIEKNLKTLNSITHRHVLQQCRIWLKEQQEKGCKAALIDAPLLFESGFNFECDVIVCVTADESTRLQRIMDRDNITEEMAKKRINSQADFDFLVKNSDYVIENTSDLSKLDLQVEKICRLILR